MPIPESHSGRSPEEDRDTLLMDLVDSALARAGRERKSFLNDVARQHPDLFEDVRSRVEWEERMGGFLREPVVALGSARVVPKPVSLKARREFVRWALAAGVMAIVALSVWLWRAREDTGPAVRLVVLPSKTNELGTDIARRLGGVRRGFVVIGPLEAARNRVITMERARSVLGATHVLTITMESSPTQITVSTVLVDAASGQTVREFRSEYKTSELFAIGDAVVGLVNGAFGLRPRVPAGVAGQAYPNYVEGITLMLRDEQSADEAIPHFDKAAQLDPASALAYAGLAEAHMQKFGRGLGEQWLDLAGENIAKAKGLNADAVEVLLASGMFQLHHGRYEEAIAEYTRATQLTPRNALAWRGLANAYERSDRMAQAAATFQKAIDSQPDYYALYLWFGDLCLRRNEFQRAEELYRRALAVAPGVVEGHMNLGVACRKQGKVSEAEKEFREGERLAVAQ